MQVAADIGQIMGENHTLRERSNLVNEILPSKDKCMASIKYFGSV